jgi:hypothetical protein
MFYKIHISCGTSNDLVTNAGRPCNFGTQCRESFNENGCLNCPKFESDFITDLIDKRRTCGDILLCERLSEVGKLRTVPKLRQ